MSYTLYIKRQAEKKLKTLGRPDRFRIVEKIEQLANNPDNPELDTKKLEGEPYYRLRVGDWRIIYDRQDDLKIIAIEKLKPRGDAYK